MRTCCASLPSRSEPSLSVPGLAIVFGWVVGIVFFLLLLSAANTAIVAMIGLLYMTARDGEMPRQFKKLNRHGVPLFPLADRGRSARHRSR